LAAIDVEVNQRALLRRLVVIGLHKAAGNIRLEMRQQTEFHRTGRIFLDLGAQHRGIKPDRAVQIGHRNIGPNNRVLRHGSTNFVEVNYIARPYPVGRHSDQEFMSRPL
jgi:hypothetical protein